MGEEVPRHDKVLAASVQSRGEVLAPGVDQLETLADTLRIRAVSVDQLIRRPDQPQHRLLNILRQWNIIDVAICKVL